MILSKHGDVRALDDILKMTCELKSCNDPNDHLAGYRAFRKMV